MQMWRRFLSAALMAASAACARDAAPPRPPRPGIPDIDLRPETVTIEARVPRHATLDVLLRDQQLVGPVIDAAIQAVRSVFDPRQLRTDRRYRLVRSLDGMLR